MKIAAARALAGLVEQPTPERVISWALDRDVVPAVAKAAYEAWQEESGAASPAARAADARARQAGLLAGAMTTLSNTPSAHGGAG